MAVEISTQESDKPFLVAPDPKIMGRPTIYSVELAMRILEELQEGKALYKICAPEGMPSRGTVIRWVYQFETFGAAYRHARKMQAHVLADSALEVAEEADDTNKLKIQKARLVHQARITMAEKYNPQEFGRKVEFAGVVGHLSHEETVRMLEEQEAKTAIPTEINVNPLGIIQAGTVTIPQHVGNEDETHAKDVT